MTSLTHARLRAIVIGLCLGLLGAVFGAVAARTFSFHVPPHSGGKVLNATLQIIALPLSFFLGVALHEGGHLLAGKLLGGKFALVIIGPLRVMRTPSGLRWGRNRRFPLFGGLALVTPSSVDNLRSYMIGLLAGGPLSSFVSGSILIGTAVLWPRMLPAGATISPVGFFLWTLLGATGLFSLAFFLASSLPSRTGGFASDGARLLALARKGPAGEQEALVFSLTALSLSGVRARDLPASMVTKASTAVGDPQVTAAMQLLAYLWALDQGRVDAARGYLNQAVSEVERVSPLLRDSLFAELAYFKARHDHDATGARICLDKAGRCELSEETRMRAEAAVLLAEHRLDEAISRASDAIAATTRSLLGASSQETIDWAASIRTEAERLLRAQQVGPA